MFHIWSVHHSLIRPGLSICTHTGILTLQPTSQPKTKAAGLRRHQIAMITGFLTISLGASAMWYNKESHFAPHITSWHGVCLPLLLQDAYHRVFVLGLRIYRRFLAFGPGHDRCRKRVVWRRGVRWGSQSQTCLEISPVVWLSPPTVPPHNCPPRRRLVNLGVRK